MKNKSCYLTFTLIVLSVDFMLCMIFAALSPSFGLDFYGLIAVMFAVCLIVGTPLALLFTGFCHADGDNHG